MDYLEKKRLNGYDMAIRSKTYRISYQEDIKLFNTIWIKCWMGLFFIFLVALPSICGPYVVYMINLSCVAIVAALGLNILTGYAGQISLGHAAFVAVGAYSTAILSSRFNMPFWICLPASGIFTALVGLLVGFPCLRLKGFYLAMATMAFGVVVEYIIIAWEGLTGGVRGISAESPSLLGYPLDSDDQMYYFLLALTVLAIIAAGNLMRTRTGRALVAVRDRDIAAEIIGVNQLKYKIMAFVIGSFYAGVGGGMYCYLMGYVHPEHFTFLLSVEYLAMIVIGGMGTVLGTIFGAVFIIIVPEFIKSFSELATMVFPSMAGKYDLGWNIAAFGLLIILFLIFEPKGLFGIWARIKICFKNWPYTY